MNMNWTVLNQSKIFNWQRSQKGKSTDRNTFKNEEFIMIKKTTAKWIILKNITDYELDIKPKGTKWVRTK